MHDELAADFQGIDWPAGTGIDGVVRVGDVGGLLNRAIVLMIRHLVRYWWCW